MTWDWEGHYECLHPGCGERFDFMREPGFPETWLLELVHDHTTDTATWRAALVKAYKGRRHQPEVKEIRALKVAQKQSDLIKRRTANAGYKGRGAAQ